MRWPRTWRTFWKPSSRPSWTASSKLSACGLRRAFSSSFRSTAIGIPRYAGGGVDAMPGGAIRRAGSLSLEDRRDALPEADAHRGEPEAALPAPELVEERRRQARTAAAEWMPERHRTAVHVQLLLGDLELARAGEHLAGERLVDLDQVHLIDAKPGALERLLARRHRTPAHDLRVDARDRGRADRCEHGKPELLRALTCHEQYGGGAVADLRGVTGGHLPALLEGRDERRELLERRVATWALVAVGGAASREGDRYEFVLEAPLLVGRDRALVRAEGEAVRILSADALPLGQDLRRLSHEHHGGREAIEELPVRVRALPHGDVPHVLHATRDDDVGVPGRDRVGAEVDGLEARPALPVDRRPRDLDRQPGEETDHARDVEALLALLVGAAEDDILDRRGIEAPAREERPHAHDAQVVGADVLEDALLRMSLPDGGADSVDHYDFAHGNLLSLTMPGSSPERKSRAAIGRGRPRMSHLPRPRGVELE